MTFCRWTRFRKGKIQRNWRRSRHRLRRTYPQGISVNPPWCSVAMSTSLWTSPGRAFFWKFCSPYPRLIIPITTLTHFYPLKSFQLSLKTSNLHRMIPLSWAKVYLYCKLRCKLSKTTSLVEHIAEVGFKKLQIDSLRESFVVVLRIFDSCTSLLS